MSTAKEWRAIARAVTPQLRAHPAECDVFVSYFVLREGARLIGGCAADDGFTTLLRLIADAQAAGIDRVTHATDQTVLGTALSWLRSWTSGGLSRKSVAAGAAEQPGKLSAGAALAAELTAPARQSARLSKRFPHRVALDAAQQAEAAVALDQLHVFLTLARQVSAVPAVGFPAPRRAPRESVSAR